ncbi:hypothetical protein ROZALSC1DRAFT_26938 [Rozella allomycis CSF55]|uniref:SHSP domain-containing protein n=1 Tax=Rozella allomycis (strain CSF55) TaxID=988480 RepID=A0A075AV20_ROZAC|nr:hypothetical protein O9G_001306 [Rozella allomycis CSF55]RKP21682.1 hypothetical protein ROZALSC1DRAFT_26938 [Rozella allomycis CSF55]|eukprot:EPZ32404.1 hypothetical protein O9G_001306 [Rozella allomycis CSF55]
MFENTFDERDVFNQPVFRKYPDEYILIVDAPGIPMQDIEVRTDGNALIVSGEFRTCAHTPEHRENRFCLDREIDVSYGLPMDADLDNLTASYKDGVLFVTIARIQKGEKKFKVEQYKERWADKIWNLKEKVKDSLNLNERRE